MCEVVLGGADFARLLCCRKKQGGVSPDTSLQAPNTVTLSRTLIRAENSPGDHHLGIDKSPIFGQVEQVSYTCTRPVLSRHRAHTIPLQVWALSDSSPSSIQSSPRIPVQALLDMAPILMIALMMLLAAPPL